MAYVTEELVASAAQTATANSSSFTIPTLSMLAVTLDVTAGSGSLLAYLQVSGDNSEWFDFPADLVRRTGDTSTASVASCVYIQGTAAATTSGNYLGIYKHIPYKYIRLRWEITGTSASFTFAARYAGK